MRFVPPGLRGSKTGPRMTSENGGFKPSPEPFQRCSLSLQHEGVTGSRAMPSILRVEVPWVALDEKNDPSWQATFCLYAYLHPERDWLLYIGKADYQTVRRRLHGEHKDELFEFLWERYG